MKFSHRFFDALLALAVWVGACDSPYGRQTCRIENEVLLDSVKGVPTAVDIVPSGSGGYVATWSGLGRSWIAELDANGVPRRTPRRLEVEETSESLDDAIGNAGQKTFWPSSELSSFGADDLSLTVLDDGSKAVAVLQRQDQWRAGGAYLLMVPPEPRKPMTNLHLGYVGEWASRISVVRWGEKLVVAWHSGALESPQIELALVSIKPLQVLRRGKIEGSKGVFSPSLATVGNIVLVAWEEIEHQNEKPVSIVRVAQLGDDLLPREHQLINTGDYLDAAPCMASLGDQIGLVYRDDADADEKAEFYYVRLDGSGAAALSPKRISRSDGFRGPRLSGNMPVFSATIRSFQHNLLVGINRFDLRGEKLGGEFQVYSDKYDFVLVAIAADTNKAMLIYAEDRDGEGRVMAGSVVCRSGP